MFRRLSSVVITLLLIAAPLSAAICDAICAGHAHMAAQLPVSHATHPHESTVTVENGSRHHEAVSGRERDASAMRKGPLSRFCDQVSAAVIAPIERGPFADHAVAGQPIAAIADLETVSSVTRPANRHGPPVPVRSISPLRI